MISMYDRVGFQGWTLADGKALQVTELVPEGPAQKAGILAKDLVIDVKGHESPSEAFAGAEVGTVLFLEVIRVDAGESQTVVIPVVAGRSDGLEIRTVDDIDRILRAPQLLQGLSKEVRALAVHDGSLRRGDAATPAQLQAALWQFIPDELTHAVADDAVTKVLQHHAAYFGVESPLPHLIEELMRLVQDCNAPHVPRAADNTLV